MLGVGLVGLHAGEGRVGGPRGRMGLLEMLGLLLWIWGWLVMGDAVAVAVLVARRGLGFVSLASGYLVFRGLAYGTDAVVDVLLGDFLLEGQAVDERGCLRRGYLWRVDLGGEDCVGCWWISWVAELGRAWYLFAVLILRGRHSGFWVSMRLCSVQVTLHGSATSRSREESKRVSFDLPKNCCLRSYFVRQICEILDRERGRIIAEETLSVPAQESILFNGKNVAIIV